MQRLSKLKRSLSEKRDVASDDDSKHASPSKSKQSGHKSKNKTASMNEKKKELLSLKRSLEQKKVLLSCERGDVETLKLILYKYRGTRHANHLSALLEYEDVSNNMKTPLVYCCINGHVECLLELLRTKVELEHLVSGSSALYHATSRGNVECVEELLIYGANPNTLNHKGWTCLMNAAYFGHDKIAELLLKYGADPDIERTEYNHKCALHFASKNGRYRVVELLLQYGANPDPFDSNDQMSSLMYAAKNGYYRIVQLLILYGANPYLKNGEGKCAIDLIEPTVAAESDKNELFTFIQQSTHIYNAIHRLVVPDTCRKIIKSLSRIHFMYPPIIAQLRSVSHMSQLGESEIDIHHFNDVVCAQLTADLSRIVPPDDDDEDVTTRHEQILTDFRNEIMTCGAKVDRCEAEIDASQQTLKGIESDIMETRSEENEMIAQINLLQRQLKLCQHKQKQLKSKQISTKNTIVSHKTSLVDLRHTLAMKNEVFAVMDKASRNILSVCNKANSVPLHHRRELHMEYQKKRNMLEENWSLWNLNDVITWICSLDPSGRFAKYKENLRKLKHLDDTTQKKRKHLRKEAHNEYNYEDEEGAEDIGIEPVEEGISDDNIAAAENNIAPHTAPHIEPQYDISEGQYDVESSDSDDGSNNDKHGASEVIIAALMPKSDSTSSEDEEMDAVKEFDVDQLLDKMGNIFSNNSGLSSSDDESYSAPDQPILECINNTVLKMCGIRDAKDRKMIMYRIEKICGKNKEEIQPPHSAFNVMDEEKKTASDNEEDIESLEDEIPSEFMCPITKQTMEDPVICSDGHSYERFAIQDWLLNHETSPMTNAKLVTKQVFPNHSLRSMIALHNMTNQKLQNNQK
eukprot:103294_1